MQVLEFVTCVSESEMDLIQGRIWAFRALGSLDL